MAEEIIFALVNIKRSILGTEITVQRPWGRLELGTFKALTNGWCPWVLVRGG